MRGFKEYRVFALFLVVFLTGCNPRKPLNTGECILVPAGEIHLFGKQEFVVPIDTLQVMKYEVTNASFSAFVNATHYVTTAEKTGEGMVFDTSLKKWTVKKGANWKHPQGPESSLEGKDLHPVVQVSYTDACAYCEWIHMRLPYESEWEFVEKNTSETGAFNHWEGVFPYENKGIDGYLGTSPVGHYRGKEKECCDLNGNVWEWCLDYYHPNWPDQGAGFEESQRGKGPPWPFSEPGVMDTLRVIKGGSFLCADNFCDGFAGMKRKSADPQRGYEHVGFRCIK